MIKTLSDYVTFINGDRGKNYPKQIDFANGNIPFVSASDLSNNSLSNASVYQKRITKDAYDKLKSGKVFQKDILLCLRGSLGKLGVVSDDMIAAIETYQLIKELIESIQFIKSINLFIPKINLVNLKT